MTDGSSKNGLPADLAGTLSDGCEPYFAFLALKKLDNHLEGHGLLEFAQQHADHVGDDAVGDAPEVGCVRRNVREGQDP